MHYIRFLKPPQISNGILTAKLTITTDLGDDFLNTNLPLKLIIHTGAKHIAIGDPISKPNIVHWKAGGRELAISIPMPKKEEVLEKAPNACDHGGWQLLIWPILTGVPEIPEAEPIKYSKKGKPLPPRGRQIQYGSSTCMFNLSDILEVNRGTSEAYEAVKGLVLPAESAPFHILQQEQKLPASIERCWNMAMWDDYHRLIIEEETGNSIARHIWDAGVVFSALIRELCFIPDKWHPAPTYLQELHKRLQSAQDNDAGSLASDPLVEYAKSLNVLELGAGCAIVSATLSHCLPHARVIATDLEEAKAIANKNLEQNRTQEIEREDPEHHMPPADSSYEVLDWTQPLPETNYIDRRKWDIILVADCTYNSDVVPALVNTLRRLVDKSPEVLIAVALKWRHDSEAIFHELMKENGMREVDKHTERCGNFDVDATGKEEEIEVYLFKGEKRDGEEKTVKEETAGDKKEAGRKRKLGNGKEEGVAKK